MPDHREAADQLRAMAELREAAGPKKWRDRPTIHGKKYRYVSFGDPDEGYGTGPLTPAESAFIAAAAEFPFARIATALTEETDDD